jgi:ribosomal-protein-alanine N-acetyltransferase
VLRRWRGGDAPEADAHIPTTDRTRAANPLIRPRR